MVLPRHADTALALWALWTYVYNTFDIAPILTITSPRPRCGKTTLAGLLAAVVPRPVMTSNISPAVIYRMIEKRPPTC